VSTAFRLEVRERYDSPIEAEALRKFLASEVDDLAWLQEWLTEIRAATAQGRQFRHVRVVSVPLSDYSRFGLWCAAHLNTAGEDIRYLSRDETEGLPGHDFWLFDDARLARMHYDDEDRFLGAEIIEDPQTVAQHRTWWDTAWRRAVRRDEFATYIDQQHERSGGTTRSRAAPPGASPQR
jgi:hypothetical protein